VYFVVPLPSQNTKYTKYTKAFLKKFFQRLLQILYADDADSQQFFQADFV